MNIHNFISPKETARGLTHILLRQINKSPENSFHLALSGGSTPVPLFKIWADEYRDLIPWEKIHLYWVDERCVPPGNPESNYGVAKKLFLDKIKISPSQIHRIQGERNAEEEARRYSTLVSRELPLTKDAIPVFDMVLLGIGTDGHTSSIFPGQTELLNCQESYAVSVNPTTGQQRIALTGYPLLQAKAILFHVTGPEKADIIEKIICDKKKAESYPAGYIANHARHVEFVLDESASEKLSS